MSKYRNEIEEFDEIENVVVNNVEQMKIEELQLSVRAYNGFKKEQKYIL